MSSTNLKVYTTEYRICYTVSKKNTLPNTYIHHKIDKSRHRTNAHRTNFNVKAEPHYFHKLFTSTANSAK